MLANPKGLTISIALSYSRDDFVLRSRKSKAPLTDHDFSAEMYFWKSFATLAKDQVK